MYCQGWQRAREATGLSASGIHFGHYMVGTFNPEILVINMTLANIPLCSGFLYAQWKTGVNVMIEKTRGDFNMEKLQIILLFEVDFNFNNKWIGCAVMYRAEDAKLLAEEQYGSQKYKSAIYQCLNKQLFYDLVRFRKCPAALCSNDAKSCYDQITLLAAALCLCRLGGSQPMVASMITTFYEMEHHIQTMFGDSQISTSWANWDAPIAGIRQGNSAGPRIWVAVSSPMLDIMREDGFHAHMIVSISKMEKKLVSFAFVDNTKLCVFGPHVNSKNVCDQMQDSVNHWEGLLCAMGGALVPTKCFWYWIDFKQTHEKCVYVTKNDLPGELTIRDDTQSHVVVPRLDPHEAWHTLGVQLAPDGNWETECQYLHSVAVDWQVHMAAHHLNPTNTTFSLKNVVI